MSAANLSRASIGGSIGGGEAMVLCRSTRGRPISSEDSFRYCSTSHLHSPCRSVFWHFGSGSSLSAHQFEAEGFWSRRPIVPLLPPHLAVNSSLRSRKVPSLLRCQYSLSMRALSAYPCFNCLVHRGSGGVVAVCTSLVPAGFSTFPLSWRTVRSSVVGTLGGALQALSMRTRTIPSNVFAIDMCSPRRSGSEG